MARTSYDNKTGEALIRVALEKTEYEAIQNICGEEFFGRFYNTRARVGKGHIVHLDLSVLELESLHPDIGKLRKLNWFSIAGNKLKNIPKTILNLENLQMFSARYNNFDDKTLELLKKLKHKGVGVDY